MTNLSESTMVASCPKMTKSETNLKVGRDFVLNFFPSNVVENMSNRHLKEIGEYYCHYQKAGGDDKFLYSTMEDFKTMWKNKVGIRCLHSYGFPTIPKDIEARCKEYIKWLKKCRCNYLSVERKYGKDIKISMMP